jgi:hypothetical protein
MARIFIFVLTVLCGSFSSPADSFRLEGLEGQSYQPPTNVEIIWKATNDLPNGLWVYKVIPQEFPMAVVTNLMTIGGFEWRNLVKPSDPPVPDKNLICFRDKKQNWTRFLNIAPTMGWVEYYDGTGSARDPINGVPSKEEAEKLALDILFRLGVDRSLLCHEKTNYDTIQGKLSRDGQMLTTNVVSRGISFARRIDGIESRGSCFMVDFGRYAKVEHFFFSWRNLLPSEAHLTLTPKQIIDEIKDGHVLSFPWEDLTGLDNIKKLAVVKMTPYYFDKLGTESLDYMYPYADLEVVADLEGTNTATFYFQCPILSTNAIKQ